MEPIGWSIVTDNSGITRKQNWLCIIRKTDICDTKGVLNGRVEAMSVLRREGISIC